MSISQAELCGQIFILLDEAGHKFLNTRQMNAVIQASTLITDELRNPTSEARPGMGYQAWLACDDTGLSSKYLAAVLHGARPSEIHYPIDSDDFGRCYRMLRAVGKTSDDIHQTITQSKDGMPWWWLAVNWFELEKLYEDKDYVGITNRIRDLIK